ncbi:MAG: DNA polymerase III subunit alpha [Candidatus Kerfeldbacteria bacterium]|nr:DNA polymerase III subunit alpha [Candidatus Kerfeldbacteria bacterium]
MSFVHLHTHSHYSLLDGLPKISELISAVKQRGMNAVALTDHGNLYGAIEFYQEATAAGIQPIVGIEAYLAPTSIDTQEPKERPFHIILLAKNRIGYEHLVKLTTIANLQGFYYKPRIDFALLEQYKEGLIVLSGCLSGEISRTILAHGVERAKQVAQKYVSVFGLEHFYLEVQHNPNIPEQATVNAALLQLHQELGIELVATADAHYIDPEDSEAQDVLLCIQTKTLLTDTNRLTMRNEDYSLTTTEVMQQRFANYPRAVENTVKIAAMTNLELELEKIQLPYFTVPDGRTPEAYLRTLCEDGLTRRYPEMSEEIRTRLDYELDIISKTGFASYFLIVQDFINWAKQQGIAVGPGRGSAAGSIVAYLTNITDVDPVHYELLFERFLNPERVSMPDIDTDFADTRRDDVLRYVEQKYGKDHVAQIITFGTMAARASIRDVGRVLGLSYGYCDRISKLIPLFSSLTDAIEQVPELKELVNQDPDAERLVSIAKKLEGVVRHTSTHACAVVVTKDPLDLSVPLQLDQSVGNVITQYSMHPVEALGLLKIDFLGLKNLTIIEQTLEIIEATTDKKIKIDEIPLNDKQTFKLLQKANTIGVFQLESSGMRRYLKQLKPTEFEDIIAMVSLYRPGPMEFIPDYIDGKHGKREITYINNRLKPILEKTYGIAVYQEQVMQIAQRLAGFTYGEADVLRKAVGKKNKQLLDEQEQKMIAGMVRNGISQSVAKQIWEFILPFARYGFNRSHAACYAMIAYRTAYLKANFPAQFMAALLTADYGNIERVALEVHHAQEMGLEVLPPDVNESFGTFSVVKETLGTEKPRLRFSLKAIKNVGEHIVDVIIAQRKNHGPYHSLENFLERVQDKDLNKKSLESLIKTGALDCFGDRNQLLMNMETLLQFAKRSQEEAETGQKNIFGMMEKKPDIKLTLSPVPTLPPNVVLGWEKELLGLYISGHPLAPYTELLQYISHPFNELKEYPKNTLVTLVGMVTSVKRIQTKNGEPMLFAGFADHTTEIEAIIFPKIFQQFSTLWEEDAILAIIGKCSDKDGSMKILVESAQRFVPTELVFALPNRVKKAKFTQLQQLLAAYANGGKYHVFLQSEGKKIDTRTLVNISIIPEVQKLFGQDVLRVVK